MSARHAGGVRVTALAAAFVLAAAGARAETVGAPRAVAEPPPVGAPLTPESSLGDLMRHPAFAGFARLLLPWDDRGYDADMPLSGIAALAPYHSHVDADVAIGGLNRLIADAAAGRTIFYDVYTEAQKRAEPAKANTGLFFLRGRPGAPFAVIAPGGGFQYVASTHEGFPYAVAINAHGYNAFVLKYRVGDGGRGAMQDMAAAVSFIFRNASTLDVATTGYSLWGSSAGARMAAAIGSHGSAAFGGDALPKPATVVMAYTSHSDIAASEPPTFALVGETDGIAPPASMERRVAALRRMGTPVDYRVYPNLGHGFGPGVGTSAAGWIDDAVRFWSRFDATKNGAAP